jgi:hypothetical protein
VTHNESSAKWFREAYKKRRAAGVCTKCGGQVTLRKLTCEKCHKGLMRNVRRYQGSKPFDPSKAGAVPKEILIQLGARRGLNKCAGCHHYLRVTYDDDCCCQCLIEKLGIKIEGES